MRQRVVLLLCLAAGLAAAAEQSLAIPAFARKYNMSCMTCHAPVPKLTAFAEEYAGNGFQLPDGEPPRAVRDTGDDELQLMRELPLALRFDLYGRWLSGEGDSRSEFQTPYLLKILSGGQVARDVAYYFYFFLGERGEVAGIEDAFLMFNNIASTGLDITVGQFQVSDPLFKRELRLPFEDYQIYRTKPGASGVNLTYDRGLMVTYGLPTGTDIVLEILNGSGIGAADANRLFDSDTYKNVMLRVSQDLGAPLRVGAFGYLGKEEQAGRVNAIWMAGPDLTLALGPLELNAQYVERRDDDPAFVGATEKTATRGGFGELIYMPDADRSRWYLAGLWNWLEVGPGQQKEQTLTGHAGYLLARNLRLIGEYTHDFHRAANKVTVGFVSAF